MPNGNTLEYAQLFQSELDRQMTVKATSGWMELNADLVKYNGGNEVRIASIAMDGLGEYSRKDGFPEGGINLTFDTHKFTQDRARTFTLDAMDVDETNFALQAGNVLVEFQKSCVIPEVDAYRYSKIAQLAIDGGKASMGFTPTPENVLAALLGDIADMQDIVGEDREIVITMSVQTALTLNSAKDISRHIDVAQFARGEVNTQVQTLNGAPIVKVPSARFRTAYTFKSGAGDEQAGGFETAAGAKAINWIIAVKDCPVAVSKTEKIRIFDPAQNIKADAWKVDYRKYHDLWIPKNRLDGVFVNIGGTAGEEHSCNQ